MVCVLFFFFKQKTAYEMRISDWSSDVCSSDLRVGTALDELSRRVGFRVIPGLGERVIYRELFPKGLTLLDLGHLGKVGLSHIAARQELREMIAGFGLPDEARDAPPLKAAAAG